MQRDGQEAEAESVVLGLGPECIPESVREILLSVGPVRSDNRNGARVIHGSAPH